MRIAISAVVGMTVALLGANARADDAPPPPPPAEQEAEHAGNREIAGWRGGFFIRDARDIFRFYPHFLAEADLNTSFGPGVKPDPTKSTALPPDVASGLKPRLYIRRARIGFDAELLRRWSVSAILEFGGQAIGNAAGTAETSAATAGNAPTATSGRYTPVQTVGTSPVPADVFINYSVCACFNLQVGQFNIPFSLDNRTGDDYYPLLERALPMRNFVVPSPRDIGALLWGDLGPKVVAYEIGVFGGDGQNRPFVGGRVDGIGRIFVRPFAATGTSDIAKYTQIGVSGRYGYRDQKAVAYDAPAITTAQGYQLWKPTYTDSQNRLVHVIPSGNQEWIGGELRMQVDRFALQSEAYFVANNTREAIDGTQLTNTERLGRLVGVGWYAQFSAWPVGDAFLTPEPGYYRPRHLDLSSRPSRHTPQGLEVIVNVSGINGSYKGATRLGSVADPKTPMGGLQIYQVTLGANYWHTKHARLGVYYAAYVAPGSGTTANEAVVPDNLTKDATTMKTNMGHVLHEMSARMAVSF
jgi:hypothetical protein